MPSYVVRGFMGRVAQDLEVALRREADFPASDDQWKCYAARTLDLAIGHSHLADLVR